MILVPAILSLLLGTLAVGLMAKLVVRLARHGSLAWRHAFAYGALVTVAGLAGVLLRFFSGVVLPGVLGAAIAFAFHALMGGWFLGRHVHDREGLRIPFLRGAFLGVLVFVLVLALGFAMGALMGLLEAQQGATAPV
ncbi:hypothetical protein [Pseudoduganella sp.]|uniref:hypothetical protein n=1 Tax=Pseudoduganella sp. TaxID=1880898 RepID=UPI0035AF0890